MSELGSRMKTLRNRNNLSQQALAESLKMGKSAIALYETGKRSPDPDVLGKLSDFFGVSVDYLLGRSDVPQVASTGDTDEIVFMAKNLADALLRISELKYELKLNDEEFLELVKKAADKYGPPEKGGRAAHRRGKQEGYERD